MYLKDKIEHTYRWHHTKHFSLRAEYNHRKRYELNFLNLAWLRRQYCY